jgi:transcriptional antiterminator
MEDSLIFLRQKKDSWQEKKKGSLNALCAMLHAVFSILKSAFRSQIRQFFMDVTDVLREVSPIFKHLITNAPKIT